MYLQIPAALLKPSHCQGWGRKGHSTHLRGRGRTLRLQVALGSVPRQLGYSHQANKILASVLRMKSHCSRILLATLPSRAQS